MSRRFFRTADEALYEQVRLALDEAWGHPTPDGQTVTCIDPAAVAPRDTANRILLSVDHRFTEFPAAAAMLPQLLASGAVEEITASEYQPVDPAP